jgi:putative ABC transport system permease protein
MIRAALKGFAARKLRTALTIVAIVLGVSLVSGTYVITDTFSGAMRVIIEDSYAGTDAVVTARKAVDTSMAQTFGRGPSVGPDVLAKVRAVPDVELALGGVEAPTKLLREDGTVLGTPGAPTFGFSLEKGAPLLTPLELTAGAWPTGPDDVVIDAGTAGREGYEVGDRIGASARGPLREFTVVGISRFGQVDSIGGATFAIFELETAQEFFGKRGRFDAISVKGRPGVSQEELAARIAAVLPDHAEVKTAAARAEADVRETEEFFGFIQNFLLAFGGIALFVGAFVIFNTLSITVAQRTREFATLRSLGATRGQVLRSVLVEAVAIGLAASALGIAVGVGLAKGLNALFVTLGIDLPQTGLVIAPRTIVVGMVVGTTVTVLAGFFPALRATRVPPIAAVREGAVLPAGRFARVAPVLSAAGAALGVAVIAVGTFADGLALATRLGAIAAGSLALFLGVALVSARLVRPVAAVLGWPAERVAGVTGRLARENTTRMPARTAVAAAALMVGLALVSFVAVLGHGLQVSIGRSIERQVAADYVITAQDGFSPISATAEWAVMFAPGVEAVSGIRAENARVFDETVLVGAVDPVWAQEVYDFNWRQGSDEVIAQLGRNGAVVTQRFASDHGLAVGDTFSTTAPSGRVLQLEVMGVHAPPEFGALVPMVAVSRIIFDAAFPPPQNLLTLVKTDGSAAAFARLEQTLALFPDAKLQTREEYAAGAQEEIGNVLALMYVLLALSVIVSLFGMVNTLVLSVFERTRELGLLRAVGMTRRQTRRMIRGESMITALLGALLGLPVGIALAALVTRAFADQGVVFAVPPVQLGVFVAVALLAGVLAAAFPARRAARLNVLRALQYE